MSEISEFADRHIFPNAFDIADQILPEFQFKKHGNKWISQNKRKIDGSEGDSAGKVYIYEDSPYCIKDYRNGVVGITTYLQEQQGFPSWIEAIKHLANETNIKLPDNNLSDEDIERISKKERQTELFEAINNYFVTSLQNEERSDADSIRSYLSDRGYTDLLPETQDEIHDSNKMELGFIPSRDKLKEHLKNNGFNHEEVDNIFKHKGIGTTNKLTIPFRFLGRIIGFAFRNVNIKEVRDKYLYSSTERSSYLFGFKRPKNNNKDLIIVEGLLDALSSQAQGIDNVVALGGTSLNSKQIELIRKYGYERITLCLDNDSAGAEGTLKALDEILKVAPQIKIYIASWPKDFKDPDELVRAQGISAFNDVIKNAKAWYSYLLQKRFERYKELGEIPDKERDDFFKEAISISNKIESTFELDLFNKEFAIFGEPFGISKETINEEVCLKREKARQADELKKAIIKANSLIESGQIIEAAETLSHIGKQSNTELSRTSYEELFRPLSREDIKATLEKESDSFESGLSLKKMPLLFPSGALSFVAGRTGRGKTASLINFSVNAARIPDSKPVVLFSYEENSRKILMKALNTYIGKSFSENNRACIYDHYNQRNSMFNSSTDREEFIRLENDFFNYLINSGRLIIVDSKDYSDELINKIYYLHKHKKVRAVLIDYIQRINLKNSRKPSRQEELKQICNDLADCAINTGLPIIIGSQFNRQATDDRSTLTLNNLSEAGDIERVANMVVAVDIKHNDVMNQPNEFYMKILKNRDGIADTFDDELIYDGNTGKISKKVSTKF